MLPLIRFRQKHHLTKNQSGLLPPKVQITWRNGRFNILGLGIWYFYWREPYYLLLTIPWSGFLMLMALSYVAINTLFALAYVVGGDCIENTTPGSFLDAFFFSVQTIASIGYGNMHPTTTYANVLVTLEALTSIFGIALMTGLAFARFSQPSARVIFSRVAVINHHNGVPTLMFRIANQRCNQILEAQMRLYLIRDEVSAEGEFMRRFYELQLLRSYTPIFTLTWTAMHPIDENSPLYKFTPEQLVRIKATIIASLSGIDETIAQALHARHSYTATEILLHRQFVDIIYDTPQGDRYIDFTHFHEVMP